MTRISKPKRHRNRGAKRTKPYTISHRDRGAVAWCAGRTRLPLRLVDVALSAYDYDIELSAGELAELIRQNVDLDELAARRFVRALLEYYRAVLEVTETDGDAS